MSVIDKLIRFYKFDLDEKRRYLRELEDQEARIETAIDTIDQEVEAEQAFSRGEANFAPYFGGYVARTKSRRGELACDLAEAREVVEEAKEIVVQAFEELKKYEIRKDQQEQRANLENERQDQVDLDEIALTSHRRRDK